jgi:predicted transcriptional regulator
MLRRMTAQEKIRSEINAFLKKTGMLPTQFGILAVKDRTLMSRINAGRGLSFETAERVRAFMRSYKKPASSKKKVRSELRSQAA